MKDSYLDEIHKERERLKKHIKLGHKGSIFEPRDYRRELYINLKEEERLIKIYNFLKETCPK